MRFVVVVVTERTFWNAQHFCLFFVLCCCCYCWWWWWKTSDNNKKIEYSFETEWSRFRFILRVTTNAQKAWKIFIWKSERSAFRVEVEKEKHASSFLYLQGAPEYARIAIIINLWISVEIARKLAFWCLMKMKKISTHSPTKIVMNITTTNVSRKCKTIIFDFRWKFFDIYFWVTSKVFLWLLSFIMKRKIFSHVQWISV